MTEIYFWTVLGVAISFILPPLLKKLGTGGSGDPPGQIRTIFNSRAMLVALASLIIGLVVVALLGDKITGWEIALTSGMGWQSVFARTFAPGT